MFEIIGQAIGDHFEYGVATQKFVVILIFVIGEDAVNPLADHGKEAVCSEVGISPVVKHFGDLTGEADLIVELPDGDQAAIAG